jgi:RimJ/RimL family protein N-acetyltransferase
MHYGEKSNNTMVQLQIGDLLKAGTILKKFTDREHQKVTLRVPKWEDLDDLLNYINSLVEENADIRRTTTLTRDREADWLGRHLAAIENNKKIAIVAEVDGRVVGQLEVQPNRGYFNHVGELGIGLVSSFRDLGIGTEMMKEVEKHLDTIGVEILYLEVFASNDRARHVYQKLDYKETGVIPRGAKRDSGYVDLIVMVKNM